MRQIIILTFICISAFGNAQEFYENLPFPDFENWAQTTNVVGYRFYSSEKDGEPEYGEKVKYKAAFIKGQTDRLSVYLESKGSFSSYSSTAKQKDGGVEFESKGYKMAYIPLQAQYSSSFLAIEIPKLNACLVLHFVPLKGKDEALKTFSNIDLSKLISR